MIYIVDEGLFAGLPEEAQAMISKDGVSVEDPQAESEIQEIAMPEEDVMESEPAVPSKLAGALAQAKK